MLESILEKVVRIIDLTIECNKYVIIRNYIINIYYITFVYNNNNNNNMILKNREVPFNIVFTSLWFLKVRKWLILILFIDIAITFNVVNNKIMCAYFF